MQAFNVTEIAACVSARLLQEYPLAVFDASPIGINHRTNQQASGPGGRVVMAPSAVAVGKPMFSSPQEAFCSLDSYDFYCYGWTAADPSWVSQYARAQKLADTVMRAFYPYMARIAFTGGKPSGDQQSNQTGAQIMLTFTVRRPVAGQLGPSASDVSDGGSRDVADVLMTNVDLTLTATR